MSRTITIHFNEEIRRRMPLKLVNFTKLPVAVKGKASGAPSVSVTEHGQFQMSKLTADFLAKAEKVAIGFDGLTVYVIKPTAKVLAKVAEKDGTFCKVSYPQKGGGATVSAAAILRTMKDWGASVQYDFAGSRNQTFAASLDDKNDWITFELPKEGKLTPKPVVPRAKRDLTKEVAKTNAAPSPSVEEELVLA